MRCARDLRRRRYDTRDLLTERTGIKTRRPHTHDARTEQNRTMFPSLVSRAATAVLVGSGMVAAAGIDVDLSSACMFSSAPWIMVMEEEGDGNGGLMEKGRE